MDDFLYFKVLSEKHKELIDIGAKKKYLFIVPQAKYIAHNMLIRSFYDNHTFFVSEYDEKMYINLNGRVLEMKNNQMNSFLGFRKQMTFNVLDRCNREVNNTYLEVIYIDNVIDESVYNQNISNNTTNVTKKEILKRYTNKDDYVRYFSNLIKTQDDLKEIEGSLNDLIDKLQNNYILMKNHVHTYSKYFQELGSDFRIYLGNKLQRFKVDDNFNLIIYELCESLVFNKLYDFLYLNIKQFTSEEETEVKVKMSVFRENFTFTIYKLDNVYNECKFKAAILEIKKIIGFNTPFEKMAILNQVNSLILKEAKECLEKNSYKKKFSPSANEIIPMWIYVIINADIPSLLTECCILQDFKLKDHSLMSEAEYNLTNLLNAVEQFKKEDSSMTNKYSYITPSIIETKSSMPEIAFDTSSIRTASISLSSRGSIAVPKSPIPKENNAGAKRESIFSGFFSRK